MGSARRWVTDGDTIPSKTFLPIVCKQRGFFKHYLSEASPAGILSAPMMLIGWDDRGRRKRTYTDRISPPTPLPPTPPGLPQSKQRRKRKKEVYLCHTDSGWYARRCLSMYKRLVSKLLPATTVITNVSAYCWSNLISVYICCFL